jgi:hypothetical protein
MALAVDVDLTSLHGVAQAITSKNPSDWAIASYYEVATALLQMDHVRMPLPFTGSRTPRYIVRPFQQQLGVKEASFSQPYRQAAHTFSQNIDDIMREKIEGALNGGWPRPQYENWIQWHVEQEWQEHISHLPGIVEDDNIPQIAKILNKTPEEVKAVNDEARWKPYEVCQNPSELQKQMFAVDVALRGLYYDKLTELARKRRLFHPIRRAVLEPPKETVCYAEPIAPYLVPIIGNWAHLQQTEDYHKVTAWSHMLLKCRGEYQAQLKQGPTNKPKGVAIEIAKKAGIDNPIKFKYGWEKIFETIPIGTGIAIGIYLGQNGIPHNVVAGLEGAAHMAIGVIVDFALKERLHAMAKSSSRIGSLADKGRWLSGRVFSYEDFKVTA